MTVLPYDPGQLPTRPVPASGEALEITVEGYPPFKDIRQSIRNRNHPRHADYKALREAATSAMAGRAWTFGAVRLDLTVYAPSLPNGCSLVDFLAGVMDTLDGSSGSTFTFLPIVYEDDMQVVTSTMQFVESDSVHYTLGVTFLTEQSTV